MPLPLHPHATGCGKVILIGEHAVVHGEPALAAGLPDGLSLRASALDDPRAWTRVQIPSWQLDLTLRPDNEHPVARACLAVLGHCDGPLTGWHIEGETCLPARAGLGSSATLSVALARLALGSDADPDTLAEASLVGEELFHGTPSGIDSAVAARGGVLRFCRGEAPRELSVGKALPLVVVPSMIPRSTATQVAKVHARKARLPGVVQGILNAFREAALVAERALAQGELAILGELFDTTHHLLGALDVSTPALDALCHEAREHGALGAKLTGAGGGGSIIALCEDPEALVTHFRGRELPAFAVRIGPSAPPSTAAATH